MTKTNAFLLAIASFLLGVVIGLIILPSEIQSNKSVNAKSKNGVDMDFDFVEDRQWSEDRI